MNRFLFPAVGLRFSSMSCRRLVVTLGVVCAGAIAQAQEAEIAIPEPLETVNTFDASQTLDTIGVTALRGINPGLNGSGVRVAQPEGSDADRAGFEANLSSVAQPQGSHRSGLSGVIWLNDTFH